MIERQVSRSRKNRDGNIVAICHPDAHWSPRMKADAIADIEGGSYQYVVVWPERKTEIRVVNGPSGKYLRTDRDNTSRNNLADLPDC